MGTIVTVGGGRYDNGEVFSILKHIVSLCDKPEPNLLYVPTAGFDYIIGDEIITDIFRQCGCKIGTLFLTDVRLTEKDIERKIMNADIIYAGGGNLKFLMDTWKATKADIYFKKAYEAGKILSGYSSGAMCWCSEGWDNCGKDKSFVFVECMGLLPYCCCPHFESDNWQNFKEEIKTRDKDGLAIEDGAAVVFRNGEKYVIRGSDGGDAYIFAKDKNFKAEKQE